MGDRRRRMQEMRVQMLDINIEFAGQDEELGQTDERGLASNLFEISQPLGARRPISGPTAYAPPSPPDAPNLPIQIFGQVMDRRPNLIMYGVGSSMSCMF